MTKTINLTFMVLSNQNAIALLLELNQNIEEYAAAIVKNVIEDKNFDLIYPPNNGLSDQELTAISELDNNEHLKNALRKILADNSAGVVFSMLNLLDGTGTPILHGDKWTGVKLVDDEPNDDAIPFADTLHDSFFDTYWEWRKIRNEKGWKLDSYEG